MAMTAFVIGITENWVFAAANVILGLKEHRSESYDLVILHDGLKHSSKELLSSIVPCEFVLFDREFGGTEKFKRVTRMAFSRFEIFSILKKYDYVIWLDADIAIVGCMDEIERECPNEMSMYLHENIPISVSFSRCVPGYNMEAECFNDGIIVLSNRIRKPEQIKDWMYAKTQEYYDYINSDQAIFNLMLQQFKIHVDRMSIKYNCYPGNKCQANASIVHPWGEGKFWNHYWNQIWDKNYRKWIMMGGDEIDGYSEFEKQQFINQTRTKKFLDKVIQKVKTLCNLY
jgi:lipopolysaccharide biosynthesis glycosyltransferase